MHIKVAEAVVEAIKNMGAEADVCENYSGRGMNGEETAGIVTNEPAAVIGWIMYDLGYAIEDIPVREDLLGFYKIYY